LEKVGMLEYKKSQIGALSGGQRQRVFIARALCNHPKFLLMDEPNTGLDSFMQDELYRLLDALKKDMAIIVISHDIGAVSAHMDKIACMNRRLFFHDNKEMSQSDFISSYGCSIDLVAHGVPHRVLETHAYAHGAPGSTCGCPTHTHAHTHTHTPSSPTPISLSNVTESKTETKTEEKAKAKAKDANKTEEK
jgi:zinc transport system ATP-binding protein